MIQQKFKLDVLGREVLPGDMIAFTYYNVSGVHLGRIEGFTKSGNPRVYPYSCYRKSYSTIAKAVQSNFVKVER